MSAFSFKVDIINQSKTIRNCTFTQKRKRARRVPPQDAPLLEDVKILLSYCKNDLERMLILMGWNLGLRCKELKGLKVGDIDLWQGEVFIRNEISKGSCSSRYIPIISNQFLDKIRDYINKYNLDSDDYLLNFCVLHPGEKKAYTKRHLRRIAKEIGKSAGRSGFHLHLLRHGIARWLLINNYPIRFVKDFLGHSNIGITVNLYGHFDRQTIKMIAATGKKPVFYD